MTEGGNRRCLGLRDGLHVTEFGKGEHPVVPSAPRRRAEPRAASPVVWTGTRAERLRRLDDWVASNPFLAAEAEKPARQDHGRQDQGREDLGAGDQHMEKEAAGVEEQGHG